MPLVHKVSQIPMELHIEVNSTLPLSGDILVLGNRKNVPPNQVSTLNDLRYIDWVRNLPDVVNNLGKASATAQSIKTPITTYDKLWQSGDRLYLAISGRKAVGLLRVGSKTLFYFPQNGNVIKLDDCLSVLDFYVCEEYQRAGYGKRLFECFLRNENARPEKLAYDRPSFKMLSFLKKHYGLSNYIQQTNNFVLFNQYFESTPQTNKGSKTYEPEIQANQPFNRQIQPSERGFTLAQQDSRLYRSVEKKLNQRRSLHAVEEMQSSTNQQREQYSRSFKNSMVSSAHTNLLFRSIQKLAQKNEGHIGFGYSNSRQPSNLNPHSFKLARNEIESEHSQQRMHQAEDQIVKLKRQIQQLQTDIKPQTNMTGPSISTDYGKFFSRRR